METKTNGKEQMALNFDNIGDPTSRQTVRHPHTAGEHELGQGNCKLLKLEFDLDTGWPKIAHQVPLQSRVEFVICTYVCMYTI